MDIKTGYFAQYRKYNKAGYIMVGITRFPPKWFDGINYTDLAPREELLLGYKRGSISWEQFESDYLEYLSNNKDYIYSLIKNIEGLGYENVVLCCFEKSNEPCHRHILANYLNVNFGYNICEFVTG